MRRLAPLLLALLPALASAGDHATTLSWRFANVVEGYDHPTRMDVYVDGVLLARSSVDVQTHPNQLTVTVPAGGRVLRVVNLALYEGSWEEHTIDNDFSVDCVWTVPLKRKGPPAALDLLCDIDHGATLVKKK